MTATAAQIRQWSDDVARDPGSLSFVPLAESYRAQGRTDAALRLCLRGLERNPTHVEAHYLLGLLYRAAGDEMKAFDEWDIALRLSPEHAGSRREIGLLCAARGDWPAALRHLEPAAAAAPADAEIASALQRARSETAPSAPAAAPMQAGPTAPATPAAPADPRADFEAIATERGMIGVLLLDSGGYVLGGTMRADGEDHADAIGAALAGAAPEAERAVRHLGLGAWRGILLESSDATVRLTPAQEGTMLAIAARRELPTGWVLRTAARALSLVRAWMGWDGA